MKTKWTASDIRTQVGRRVLITGANSGIGFEAALELARHGAELILPARTIKKADGAIERIKAQVPEAIVYPGLLDLADLSSVRAFASQVKLDFPGQSLDLLINNAGVMAVPNRELTVDGYERQFATNYLGPFALTALLFGSVKAKAGSRIVTVSSTASKFGKIDFENLQSERRYSPMWQAYSQSKLADSMFALELQRRLTAASSEIISTAAHPGYSTTNLQVTGPGEGSLMMRLSAFLVRPQDAVHGALPTLYAAVAPEATAGGYYGPDGFQELKGHPAAAKIATAAKDAAVAKRLWAESERLTGLEFEALSSVK